MLKRCGIVFGIVMLLFQVTFASVETHVLSYEEWKAQQVEDSHSRVVALTKLINLKKRQIQSDSQIRTEAGFTSDLTVTKLNAQLFEEQSSLELNKKLSMSDYIIMYLTTLPTDKSTYLKVAKQMSAEDMADILLKYNQQSNPKSLPSSDADATKSSTADVNK